MTNNDLFSLLQDNQIQELEVRLQNSEADLKIAERRIATLQDALKGQEEEFGSGEEEDLTHSITDSLSSSGGSYRIGEYPLGGSSDNLSDKGDADILSGRLTGLSGGRSTTPRAEDFTSPTYRSRRRKFDLDADKDVVGTYSRRHRNDIEEKSEEDMLSGRRSKGRVTLSDDEEDVKPKKRSYLSKYGDEDDDLLTTTTSRRHRDLGLGSGDDETERKSSSRSRRDRLKLSDDEDTTTSSRRYNRTRISDDEDDDITGLRRKREKVRLSDEEEEKEKDVFKSRRSREKSLPLDDKDEVGTTHRRRYQLSDDEDDKVLKGTTTPLANSDDLLGRTGRGRSKEPSPGRFNGAAVSGKKTLPNGTKTSDSSLGEKAAEEDSLRIKQRKESIKGLVSQEQQQLYSVAQKRRRRRRTGDAKSSRQTAQDNESTL